MKHFEVKYYNELNAPIVKKTWMWQQYLTFNSQKKSCYENKIAGYLDDMGVEFLFKCPVWVSKEERIFFVSYYLPDYTLMIDIETNKHSEYYCEENDELRKQLLSSIKGKRYFIVNRRDLKSGDFHDKISKAMSNRLNRKQGNHRKRNKSQNKEEKSGDQNMTKRRAGI